MTVTHEEHVKLSEEVGGLEREWKTYKEAFVGVAEELCGRNGEWAECQGVETKDGRRANLQRQYSKRWKPGKK